MIFNALLIFIDENEGELPALNDSDDAELLYSIA